MGCDHKMSSPIAEKSVETKPHSAVVRGKEVLLQEAAALEALSGRLGESFEQAIEVILGCSGRTVLTGMGKHGIVARKIAATMASTGTLSFYMDPAEGRHGDLGMIDPSDVIIAVSNSGNTHELVECIPFFKRNHNVLIAMTGNSASELARHADIVLDISVEREACPLNLAPTTSTTAAIAMGDALAVVLLERRGFREADFALRHPSGTLGKRLLLRVSDLLKNQANPIVGQDASFDLAMQEMASKNRGAVSVVDGTGVLVGIVTDGDVKRIFQRAATQNKTVAEVYAVRVCDLMTRNPICVVPDTLAAKAVGIMEDGPRKILVLPVVDEQKKPIGMIQLHDLVSAGV